MIGIFQFDTPSFREIISKFNPKNFQDLILITSLNRPGANKNINDIYKKRNSSLEYKNLQFDSQELNSILDLTYGDIIFEEQVTQILSFCLSLNISESELLRKKMKEFFKEENELENFKSYFLKHSSKNLRENDKNLILNKLIQSIPYMFNKAHATSYSYLSYYTAYLKANYFLESSIFFLNKNIGDKRKTYSLIEEILEENFEVSKPEINSSEIE